MCFKVESDFLFSGEGKMKKIKISLLLCTLLVMGAILPLVLADVDLNSRFDEIGNYGVVKAGVGLKDTTSGIISIDVPGTVYAAYLYWAGIDYSPGGDDSVVFDGIAVTADESYGPELWYDDKYHYVYFEDVTTLVNSGPDTYTIADVDLGYKNYGAGLVVVYEDPLLFTVRVVLMDGLDGFWFGWSSPLGPDSEVACFDFAATTSDRDVEMFLFVGGTEHDDRPNEVWTETGTGAMPSNIITSSTAAGGLYPLFGSDGAAWDTHSDIVEVPAGDEWLCVQVESIPELGDSEQPYYGRGTSALLITAGFVLPVERPDGLSPGFWKHNIRVALGYPGRYSVPHEGEPRIDYDTIVALAEAVTGETGTDALQAALDALTAKGPGSESTRLDMANAFNAAAGYDPYYD
jgi:hypothetical protein